MTEHIVHHTKLFYQSSVTNSVHSKEKQFKYALIRQYMYTENIVVTAIFSSFVYDIMQVLLRKCQRVVFKGTGF